MWSLREHPGALRLKAMTAPGLLQAKNTLTQKIIGTRGEYRTELNVSGMKNGQRTGLAYLCFREENWIGVVQEEGRRFLRAVTAGVSYHGPELKDDVIRLGSRMDLAGETRFLVSLDGREYLTFGGACSMSAGFWKGARIALFTYTTGEAGGFADFHSFRHELDGWGIGHSL